MKMLLCASIVSLAFALPASAAVDSTSFTLDTDGGDGFVVAPDAPFAFTLSGNNNGADAVITTFGTVASSALNVSGQFRYQSDDVDGSSFDRAGFFVNSIFTQLSLDTLLQGEVQSGFFSFAVAAGEEYGFYIDSSDGELGRAQLSVGEAPVGAVPEPATWAMMLLGFGVVGFALRRRRQTTTVRFQTA